jgi:transcription-repair coupling factor (superfamily II helicase)
MSAYLTVEQRALAAAFALGRELTLAAVPDGLVGKTLADLLRASGSARLLFVARDGQRLAEVARALAFFAPDIEALEFPAWDCLPYDRVSPHVGVVAARMATLARLAVPAGKPAIVLTTVNAALQRVPERRLVAVGSVSAVVGGDVAMDDLTGWLETNGFLRSPTVREPGEYAVRGGILDLYAAGWAEPVRLDFFGDTLESIRTFDAETQRTIEKRSRIDLVPVSEMVLTRETIGRFRERYLGLFGVADRDDQLYHAISEGRTGCRCSRSGWRRSSTTSAMRR